VACGVPPKGYANLPVRESVRKMLDELRAETGIRDLSDLLVVLVRTYRDYTSAISKIQELLTSGASKTANIQTGTSTANPSTQATQSKAKSEEKERVKIISLEWARKQGMNIEEYMMKKERQGFLCNEANRKIYCVWREDVEQVIVDLNNAGAKMEELEKVLSGERLETAKVAIEAGLMWYDNKEKRWRAPL
jgi:RecG-like helicase